MVHNLDGLVLPVRVWRGTEQDYSGGTAEAPPPLVVWAASRIVADHLPSGRLDPSPFSHIHQTHRSCLSFNLQIYNLLRLRKIPQQLIAIFQSIFAISEASIQTSPQSTSISRQNVPRSSSSVKPRSKAPQILRICNIRTTCCTNRSASKVAIVRSSGLMLCVVECLH